ncbi:MoxR-like ATPase [Constrictibacter sp. MBR-5]|jgi:MoxR-like ATPase|uniref:AAA family ATPase n=1 Tax=Constrictibacter sp. MBR-5 TaxID=3156467 RepID=UPI003397A5AB
MLDIHNEKLASIEQIQKGFAEHGYICSRSIATAVYVACHLGKPILVEGPAGVGKTELANTTAEYLDLPLIRMQCYEGLDEAKALYEWKYGKQLLYTQILKDKIGDLLEGANTLADSMNQLHRFSDVFFSEQFLEPRPLLKALREEKGCVLLIDEVDKSDQEFEAFLLEILSEFQISIPELGTIVAGVRPFVFLTSNNMREMSDALKRRCLHLFVPFPDSKLERKIIQARVPHIPENLRDQLVSFVQQVRQLDLKKQPSVSETIDWARVLLLLHSTSLDADLVRETLNVFLKFEEDIKAVDEQLYEITRHALKEQHAAE